MPLRPLLATVKARRATWAATLALIGSGAAFQHCPMPPRTIGRVLALCSQQQHHHHCSSVAWLRARNVASQQMRRHAPPLAMAAASSSSSSSSSSSTPPASTANWSPAVYVPDQQRPFRLSDFAIPKLLLETGELESVLLPSGMIRDRIDKMAQDILADVTSKDEGGKERALHLVCTLKGAGRFFQELVDALRRRAQAADIPLRMSIDYVRVKSYVGMQSSGQVQVEGADVAALVNKDVILVEDMIDTGTTLRKLVPLLQSHNPASLRVVSLFQKRLGPEKNPSTEPIPCLHVVGFSLPDKFAVGYGMDYDEVYRDLEHLCLLSPKGEEIHNKE